MHIYIYISLYMMLLIIMFKPLMHWSHNREREVTASYNDQMRKSQAFITTVKEGFRVVRFVITEERVYKLTWLGSNVLTFFPLQENKTKIFVILFAKVKISPRRHPHTFIPAILSEYIMTVCCKGPIMMQSWSRDIHALGKWIHTAIQIISATIYFISCNSGFTFA
jgi:hypothetical protein